MENGTYPQQAGATPLNRGLGYELQGNPSYPVQSTVITVSPNEPPVRDHLIWSIFNLVYMNFCCLGLVAVAFSVKSRDRKMRGDKIGAQSYGSTSRSLNIAATILTIICLIIVIAVTITPLILVAQQLQNVRKEEEYPSNRNRYGK
ncbi:dispanin subfamily A member 2b-like isoform 1-T1 [Discoglossus pictus]